MASMPRPGRQRLYWANIHAKSWPKQASTSRHMRHCGKPTSVWTSPSWRRQKVSDSGAHLANARRQSGFVSCRAILAAPQSKRAVGALPRLYTRPGFDYSAVVLRSEEHTSETQSLMRISYDGFCLLKNTSQTTSAISS